MLLVQHGGGGGGGGGGGDGVLTAVVQYISLLVHFVRDTVSGD